MSSARKLTISFRSLDEASRCDLSRIGVVAAASGDGLTVEVEPDFTGPTYDRILDEPMAEIIRSSLAACGVFAEVACR